MSTTIQETANRMTKLIDFRNGKAGIYEGIPAEEYHALRAVSSTMLKRIHCESPKHAYAVMMNPELVGSDEITIGAAAHAVLLEPEEFNRDYICADQCGGTVGSGENAGQRCKNGGVKLSKDGIWLCGVHGKKFENECTGTILTPEDYRRVAGIHDAVWANSFARKMLQRATARELSVLWMEGPILCKARYDVLCGNDGILPDVKTCRTVKPEWFTKDAFDRGYHLQLAHYVRGAVVAEIGASLPVIIAVENDDPFDVVVFEPTIGLRDAGVAAREDALMTLLACQESGVWPGYSQGVVAKLDLPNWKK